jgi:hypothetical protein
MLSKLAKTGEVHEAQRGYQLPDGPKSGQRKTAAA